ncbi:hypothetical protein AOLI_G00140300 [Acnodon oligacanthus]
MLTQKLSLFWRFIHQPSEPFPAPEAPAAAAAVSRSATVKRRSRSRYGSEKQLPRPVYRRFPDFAAPTPLPQSLKWFSPSHNTVGNAGILEDPKKEHLCDTAVKKLAGEITAGSDQLVHKMLFLPSTDHMHGD